MLKTYRKKPDKTVIAVQLSLDTGGFEYEKWGNTQTCNAGDWLVDNNGDVYTVSETTFASTYKPLSPGIYYKPGTVWAEQASSTGDIDTREGQTHYQPGDYLVYNNANKTDGYAIEKELFESMYELADG